MVDSFIIVDALEEYRNSHGGHQREWYAGITNSPARRHVEHGKPRLWASRNAQSEKIAREAEENLLELKYDGCDGGGGDPSPTFVYIFQKNSIQATTRQR